MFACSNLTVFSLSIVVFSVFERILLSVWKINVWSVWMWLRFYFVQWIKILIEVWIKNRISLEQCQILVRKVLKWIRQVPEIGSAIELEMIETKNSDWRQESFLCVSIRFQAFLSYVRYHEFVSHYKHCEFAVQLNERLPVFIKKAPLSIRLNEVRKSISFTYTFSQA